MGGTDRLGLLRALRDHDVQLNPAAEALFADERFVPLRDERVIEIAPAVERAAVNRVAHGVSPLAVGVCQRR